MPDACKEKEIRFRHGTEVIHLPKMVDAQLQHGKFVFPADPAERDRKPDGAVQVPGGFIHTKPL